MIAAAGSVSLNAAGNVVAIGAYLNNDGGSSAGHTRVYEFDGSVWVQRGSDIDGEATGDSSGRSISLNAVGNMVAIGAPFNDDGGSAAGHTRVFEWNGSAWVQRGADIDGEASFDQSGYSVSLNAVGDVVAIGAPVNDDGGSNAGHTRVFEWNGSTWVQRGSDIDGEAADDESGYSVSLNAAGDAVAIGARRNDGAGTDAGHTRVFEWDGSDWVQRGSDIDGEAVGDESGVSVSLNAVGDVVAIGAPNNDGAGTDAGHTRVYEWNGSDWVQRGSDIFGEAAGDYSGYGVSLNAAGDAVAIGAPDNAVGTDAGHTRVFEFDGSAWTQRGTDINGEAAGDNSGVSVSLNAAGDVVAIGAYDNDGAGLDAGHTRVYEFDGSGWTYVQAGADIDGEGADDQSGFSVSLNAAGTSWPLVLLTTTVLEQNQEAHEFLSLMALLGCNEDLPLTEKLPVIKVDTVSL